MEAMAPYLSRWTSHKRVAQDSHDGISTNIAPGNLLNRNMIVGIAYSLATVATLIKTVAWYLPFHRMIAICNYLIFTRWFNQWPFIAQFNFFLKWFLSVILAFFEYLPLTYSFVFATQHQVYLSLLTAYMEFGDNSFRMLQQLALQDTLYWFDWVAAGLLGLCVGFQGYFHSRKEAIGRDPLGSSNEMREATNEIPVMESKNGLRFILVFLLFSFSAAMILLSLLEGATGQAYALATIATAAKTFAWWINQYPAMLNRPFVQKWLVGWGIGATLEYFPLIGAFTIASTNHVLLSVMTAYMEALDNAFRMGQQFALGKPLYWFDWCTALGMACAVAFQGAMHSLVK